MSGVRWYLCFHHCLISLNITTSGPLHVAANDKSSSFLWLSKISLHISNTPLSIYWWMDISVTSISRLLSMNFGVRMFHKQMDFICIFCMNHRIGTDGWYNIYDSVFHNGWSNLHFHKQYIRISSFSVSWSLVVTDFRE